MEYNLFETLQVVVSIFCLTMAVIGTVFPLHPRFDRNFGALLGVLGLFYGARVLHFTRIEHLTASIFPVILFALFGRVFRLNSKPVTRFLMLVSCMTLSLTSLVGGLHESNTWQACLFTYEFLIFAVLVYEAFSDARAAQNKFERTLKFSLGFWLLVATIVQVTDWTLLKIVHVERVSSVLIIPFAYWMVFVLSSGGLRSFRREVVNFGVDLALIVTLVMILYWRIPAFSALDALKTSIVFFAMFVGYRTLRRRATLSFSRHGSGFKHIAELGTQLSDDELLKRLEKHPWVDSIKVADRQTWSDLKIDGVVSELKASRDPAIKPQRNIDWLYLDAMPDWMRQAFLFAWESLGADMLVYLPKRDSVLSLRLRGFAQDPEFREDLARLGRSLRHAFEERP